MYRSSTSNVAFSLFLLVNATLILRPAELVSALASLPIYEVLIVTACAMSFRQMQRQMSMPALYRQPMTLCVVGVFVAVLLSHVTHMYLGGTKDSGISFLKTVVYYVLLMAAVDTPERLKKFLLAIVVFSSLMISLCVIDYVGWHDFQFVKHIAENDGVSMTGEDQQIHRMNGTGIFSDPNDISLLIVAAGILCVYFLTDRTKSELRFGWLFPLAVLAIGLFCTRSRGGLMAAGAAGFVLILSRYGRKPAIGFALLGLCALPLVAGRQGSIDLESGTGHDRLLLWRDGFAAIKSPNLLFGIGQGMYADMAGLVAHNSYVHAYVELGLFGGTLFFGCFFFAALAMYRLSKLPPHSRHPELERLRPYMAAMLAGWAAGLLSLSRCYVVPTYMILGIAAAYLKMTGMTMHPPRLLIYWDRTHLMRLAGGSAAFFASLFLFVVLFAR